MVEHGGVLHIGSAIGGSAKNGMGGDGIAANGENTKVFVGEAAGGNCDNGVGGAGIIAVGGANVSDTEKASGGDGAVSPGKAVLTDQTSLVDGSDSLTDGNLLESKKTPDPEKINSYALLQNALRNGKTEIVLDSSYKDGRSINNRSFCFTCGSEPVKISGAYDGKLQKIDGGLRLCGGNWELSGLDITSKIGPGLNAFNQASVRFTGNLASATDRTTVMVSDNAMVEITGDISFKGKEANTVWVNSGTLTITGNVTGKDYPAIYIVEGEVIVDGSVTYKNSKSYAVIIEKGDLWISGSIKATHSQYCFDGGTVHNSLPNQ